MNRVAEDCSKLKILLITICIFICSCTNPKDANKALESMGFTNIKMTGYSLFACSEDDFYHTGFEAVNSQGKVVSGTVCSGLFFKNSTVRF